MVSQVGHNKVGGMMIYAIFKNKRMIGYSICPYRSDDLEETVVEIPDDKMVSLIGIDDWSDATDTIVLDGDDEEMLADSITTMSGSRKVTLNVAKPKFELLKDIPKEKLDKILAKYPSYEVNHVYAAGNKFVYRSKLYEVLQNHTSQSDWLPNLVQSLYKEIMPAGVVGSWRQPFSTHDAYKIGDKVVHNDQTWVCVKGDANGNNVWQPGVYGWVVESPEEPTEYKEWTQPTGGHDAYAKKEIVTHNGKLWISTINANVWEPGVHGWNEYAG